MYEPKSEEYSSDEDVLELELVVELVLVVDVEVEELLELVVGGIVEGGMKTLVVVLDEEEEGGMKEGEKVEEEEVLEVVGGVKIETDVVVELEELEELEEVVVGGIKEGANGFSVVNVELEGSSSPVENSV